jgi:hypothetical protein
MVQAGTNLLAIPEWRAPRCKSGRRLDWEGAGGDRNVELEEETEATLHLCTLRSALCNCFQGDTLPAREG